jgi:hypothetical protein
VPIPNGQQQGAGQAYAAKLLHHQHDDALDVLSVDLKAAYPTEADLSSLVRTVSLHRDAPHGWVELVDTVAYASGGHTFESVLTTFGDVDIADGHVRITGKQGALEITCVSDAVSVRVERVTNVDLAEGEADVNLIIFALSELSQTGEIRLHMRPID